MINEVNPQLTPQEIQEFQQIVKKAKGIELTFEEAENQASRMVKLAYLVMNNLPIENRFKKAENIDKDRT